MDEKREEVLHDKPWRPGDHPRPGPSWKEPEPLPRLEHEGLPDAED